MLQRFLFCATLLLIGTRRLSAEIGVTEREIRLGSCASLSGATQDFGIDEIAGAEAYIEYVNNEKGGIHGRKIRLESFDDRYDPDDAIRCFDRLVDAEVFAAGFFTGTAPAVKYVLAASMRKIPLIGFTSGAGFIYEPVKRYVFNTRASYLDETRSEVDHLWSDLGVRRFGLIMQSDAFGAAGLEGIGGALVRVNSAPVAVGSFPRNTTDVDAAIAQVRAAKPEVVFLACNFVPAAEILKRSHMLGWKPIFVVLAGRKSIVDLAGPASEGLVYADLLPSLSATKLSAIALHARLMHQYSSNVKPSDKTLEGFVHAMVVVEGLRRAGKDPTRDGFVDALEAIHDFDLGLGPRFKLSYSPSSHKGLDSFIFVIVRGGKPQTFSDWKSAVSVEKP